MTEYIHVMVRASREVAKCEEHEVVEEWNVPVSEMPDDWQYMNDDEKAKWIRSAEMGKYWINAYEVVTPVVVSATETGAVRTTVSVKGETWF